MATITFLPYPETGHINASLKLGKSLRRLGHRVIYLALADYEMHLRSQQLDVELICRDIFPFGFLTRAAVGAGSDNLSAIVLHARNSGSFGDVSRELFKVVDRVQPDIFVTDVLLPDPARMVADAGVPAILINTMLFDPWSQLPEIYDALSGIPELILCPREFDFPNTRRRTNSYYVEASIDLERAAGEFPWDRLNPGKRLIYCSLGSQNHLVPSATLLFEKLLQAISPRRDLQLVIAVGNERLAAALQKKWPHSVVVATAPQLEILKRANVMVSHAGLNSVKESIYFGVPMILFPLIRDQPSNAARAVYHGLAVKGAYANCSIERISGLVECIDGNPSIRTRIKTMAQIFRQHEDAEAGTRRIVELVPLQALAELLATRKGGSHAD